MEHVRPPQSLPDTGNMVENWCTWKQQFELFMDLTENTFINQPKSIKAKLLLNFIGPVGVSALEKITFNESKDKEDMHILLQKFDEYFNPPKKEVVARHHFFTEKRNNNMSLDDYIEKLKKRAETCNFELLEESMIRDKIIMDIKDPALLKKILNTKELNLENLVRIVEAHNSKSVSMKESMESKMESKTSNESENSKESKNSNESTNSNGSKNSKEFKELNASMKKSNTAMEKSNTSVEMANTAMKKSNTAVEKSNTSVEKSNTAVEKSNTAVDKSNTAMEKSNTVVKKSNVAEKPSATRAKICWRCKKNHPLGKCLEYNRVCKSCGEKGHITDPSACRIAFLKKKEYDRINNINSVENVNTNMSNLKMNVLDTPKVENNCYQENLHSKQNFYPEKFHTTKLEPTVTNTQPSAPPLAAINSLYPNINTMQPMNLPEASSQYVPPRTNVPLVQAQCSARTVEPPSERNTRATKRSNDCILS